MRQRCAIARVFNCPADLLLMDESLKSLDYNLRIAMIGYLVNLWEDTRKAIIFITHEIDEALLLGDRILVLSNRPAKVIREFDITMPKQGRCLTDTYLTEIRNELFICCKGFLLKLDNSASFIFKTVPQIWGSFFVKKIQSVAMDTFQFERWPYNKGRKR